MNVFDVIAPYLADPVTREVGCESIGAGPEPVLPAAVEPLRAVFAAAAVAGPLTGILVHDDIEADTVLPAGLKALGFSLDDFELVWPDDGADVAIQVTEYETFHLFHGPGYVVWRYEFRGMGYPVSDCVWYAE